MVGQMMLKKSWPNDPLGVAKGFYNGCLVGVAIWLIVLVLAFSIYEGVRLWLM